MDERWRVFVGLFPLPEGRQSGTEKQPEDDDNLSFHQRENKGQQANEYHQRDEAVASGRGSSESSQAPVIQTEAARTRRMCTDKRPKRRNIDCNVTWIISGEAIRYKQRRRPCRLTQADNEVDESQHNQV